MDPIYVTGHRNPDTDSIVAAIAYAALRNACGEREYEAACLGQISEETRIVLERFGFAPPMRLNDVYTQVRDLDFDRPPVLNTGVTVERAFLPFPWQGPTEPSTAYCPGRILPPTICPAFPPAFWKMCRFLTFCPCWKEKF